MNPAFPVHGGDAALSAQAAVHAGAPIHFVPDASSDVARALGLGVGQAVNAPATIDLLDLGRGVPAVNMVVLGPGPDRLRRRHRRRGCRVEIDGRVVWDGPATTVVVASGEYLRGRDVVPRGHPGDGRLEVQVYALASSQRAGMRRRLATGTHLPHPQIQTAGGERATVQWARPVRLEVDGVDHGVARALAVVVQPGALTIV